MHLTKEFINNELYKAQQLLWSGSLDEVDQAHNIVASLLNDLDRLDYIMIKNGASCSGQKIRKGGIRTLRI